MTFVFMYLMILLVLQPNWTDEIIYKNYTTILAASLNLNSSLSASDGEKKHFVCCVGQLVFLVLIMDLNALHLVSCLIKSYVEKRVDECKNPWDWFCAHNKTKEIRETARVLNNVSFYETCIERWMGDLWHWHWGFEANKLSNYFTQKFNVMFDIHYWVFLKVFC